MLDKTAAPSFRTSVGGYNKEDINNYIREINADFLASSKDYESRISELRAANAKKDKLISELREKLNAVNGDEIKQLRDRNEELTAALSKLGDDYAIGQERIGKLESELNSRRVCDGEGGEEVEDTRSPEERQKADAYDKVSAQIGRILLDARENADSIIAEAKAEADRIREESDELRRDAEEDCRMAQEKLRNVGAAFGCSVDDMAKRIEKEVERVIGDVCGMLRSASEGADEEIGNLSRRLGAECGNMLDSAVRSAKKDAANVTGAPAVPSCCDCERRQRSEQTHRDEHRPQTSRDAFGIRSVFTQRDRK